jgi:hypothetical protein
MTQPRNLSMRHIAARLPILLLAIAGLSTAGSVRAPAVKPEPPSMNVAVATQREGDVTHFYVTNRELCEVTMTFTVKLDNLKSCAQFPYTITLPPHQVTEAFSLAPVDPSKPWGFDYTNYFKLGSACAEPDDSFVYQLPFPTGARFKVTQGYNGTFSHTGANQYAIDWKMPEGTPVRAARGGLVVRVKDDSNTGGASMDYDRYNNYVLIRHNDGTLGQYCHLKKGGCVVKPGQVVTTGQLIAHSGNTGFSSGAHLHFCVFKTLNGRERISIPTKFQTATDTAVTLTEGETYRAVGGPVNTSVAAAKATEPSRGGASPQ